MEILKVMQKLEKDNMSDQANNRIEMQQNRDKLLLFRFFFVKKLDFRALLCEA